MNHSDLERVQRLARSQEMAGLSSYRCPWCRDLITVTEHRAGHWIFCPGRPANAIEDAK